MLKRALHNAGVRPPQEQLEECYRMLDPEASGTISFSELNGELRRVKKMLTQSSGYGQGSGYGLQRASSSGSSVYGRPGSASRLKT